MKIDQRLAALYNEYVEAGKECEFLDMLQFIIDNSPETARRTAARKAKKIELVNEQKEAWKSQRKAVEKELENMSFEEKIALLNTPWSELPEWLKEDNRMVKWPQEFNFIRFADLSEGLQQETFGARLVRYMEAHRFVTTNPDTGNPTLDFKRFAEVCNEFAEKFDTGARRGHRPQKTRITQRDLSGYTNFNICPKVDKMTVISEAMNVDIGYIGGYGDDRPPKTGVFNAPFGEGPLGTKFRKKRAC